MTHFNLAAIQLNSVDDVTCNIATVSQLLTQVDNSQPTIVVLPECWASFDAADDNYNLRIAEPVGNGPIQQQMSAWAKQYGIWLVGGTVPICADNDKYYAASLVFNPAGECVAQYNKIHLFDVKVSDNTGSYTESRHTQAGEQVVVVDTGFARIGLAVCYDVRFPELFRVMNSAKLDVICLPSAFTYVTGKAHWQVLLQARAIENQVYVVAANQVGKHVNGRETWGHSMIIDAWGHCLAEASTCRALVIQQTVDSALLTQIRAKMPMRQHIRIQVPSVI